VKLQRRCKKRNLDVKVGREKRESKKQSSKPRGLFFMAKNCRGTGRAISWSKGKAFCQSPILAEREKEKRKPRDIKRHQNLGLLPSETRKKERQKRSAGRTSWIVRPPQPARKKERGNHAESIDKVVRRESRPALIEEGERGTARVKSDEP